HVSFVMVCHFYDCSCGDIRACHSDSELFSCPFMATRCNYTHEHDSIDRVWFFHIDYLYLSGLRSLKFICTDEIIIHPDLEPNRESKSVECVFFPCMIDPLYYVKCKQYVYNNKEIIHF